MFATDDIIARDFYERLLDALNSSEIGHMQQRESPG
jgi:hypothetical protein